MKIVRTISAVLLAFLVLFSSTSFMVGLHYCMGRVQEVAIFTKAEGCKMQQALPVCHQHSKPACCEDETVYHEGTSFKTTLEQHVVASAMPIEIEQPFVLMAEVIPSSCIRSLTPIEYDPPLPDLDLIIQHQVFLI